MFDPVFVRNAYTSCLSLLPDSVGRYVAMNMNTVPKFLNHVLFAMAACNLFLILSSLSISILTFLAALLLGIQNASVLLTVQSGQGGGNLLRPTEFMMGVCLGITIGGTILAFFVCLAFGRVHAFCAEHSDGPGSCGWRTASLNGVWWWSSCIFWLDLIACFLLAMGHRDLVSQSSSHQYQSVHGNDSSSSMSSGHQNLYQGGMGPPPPSFAQQPTPSNAPVVGGRYSDIPEVVPQSESSRVLPPSDPLQAQVLHV